MKQVIVLILACLYSIQAYTQDRSFRSIYVYEGYVQEVKGKRHSLILNFIILHDSAIIGSCYYKQKDSAIQVVGKQSSSGNLELLVKEGTGRN